LGTDANLTRPAFIRGPIGGLSKRVFDALMAISALIWLLPLFLLLALAIKLHDGGPVLYRHSRIGRNCSRFSCIKFRTMVADAEQTLQMHLQNNPAAAREWQQTRKLKHDPRVTALGSVLRKTSLDELPQLLNIAKGDMSFVGPRPIVAAEIPNYGPAIVAYFRARPGLTGQWQVSGRNDVSYDTRVALDRGYIEDWSFSKDIRILIKTFGVVLRSRGCY
jgi:exopolysaccharide production protein ExoY